MDAAAPRHSAVTAARRTATSSCCRRRPRLLPAAAAAARSTRLHSLRPGALRPALSAHHFTASRQPLLVAGAGAGPRALRAALAVRPRRTASTAPPVHAHPGRASVASRAAVRSVPKQPASPASTAQRRPGRDPPRLPAVRRLARTALDRDSGAARSHPATPNPHRPPSDHSDNSAHSKHSEHQHPRRRTPLRRRYRCCALIGLARADRRAAQARESPRPPSASPAPSPSAPPPSALQLSAVQPRCERLLAASLVAPPPRPCRGTTAAKEKTLPALRDQADTGDRGSTAAQAATRASRIRLLYKLSGQLGNSSGRVSTSFPPRESQKSIPEPNYIYIYIYIYMATLRCHLD